VTDPRAWHERLCETRLVRRLVEGGRPWGPPRLAPAGSCCQTSPAGVPLLLVGDAASSFDPLSSQGIVKALRSGAFAAYAAADFLQTDDARSLARYQSFVDGEFAAYRRTWREHYDGETRWRDRDFWRRRTSEASVPIPKFA